MAAIVFKIITAVGAVLSSTHMGQVSNDVVNPKIYAINKSLEKGEQLANNELREACSHKENYEYQLNKDGTHEVKCMLPAGVELKGGKLRFKSKKSKKKKGGSKPDKVPLGLNKNNELYASKNSDGTYKTEEEGGQSSLSSFVEVRGEGPVPTMDDINRSNTENPINNPQYKKGGRRKTKKRKTLKKKRKQTKKRKTLKKKRKTRRK
jgi:hypothetical protein